MQKDRVVTAYRKAIESLYTGLLTAVVRETSRDPVTKVSDFREKTVYEDIPCRLSFSTAENLQEEKTMASENIITLFTSPEIDIKTNSKITVKQNGYTFTITNANKKSYASHNEYSCTEFLRWL
ncbi:hypothetical protein [Peptoniphilus genitalis]|uniref:Phage protein n=1 Tax=Peptoniphilus genitalis TaxID=3036303 RepID=A0ABY4TLQ3_9FIRM|nr:hypothetical protein [Peptoniphilus sp. SAHP1]URN40902.1 hypothetical protein M9426_06505 [Peptoniphilus sp. SAHP1]